MEESQIELKKEEKDDTSLYKDITHTFDGFVNTPVGPVKRIKTTLMKKDILQDCHARLKVKRDNFRIRTGLYAVGNPNQNSPVLVTANYKLTFDKLRKELENLDLWIMVIDTKGINVWCAAGKGTFGTDEIIYKIKEIQLDKVVSHRELILPQLGAPGVSAHIITKHTGFKVIYGTIRAEDIPNFLSRGCKTTDEIRQVKFNFVDRLVLTPIELLASLKYFPLFPLLLFILNWISYSDMDMQQIFQMTLLNSIPYSGAFLIGAILLPMILPIIPFKSFALKGFVLGTVWSCVTIYFSSIFLLGNQLMALIGNGLLMTAIITMFGLNFTGSTTYTSFSGVKRETLLTFPIVVLGSLIGLGLLLVEKLGG